MRSLTSALVLVALAATAVAGDGAAPPAKPAGAEAATPFHKTWLTDFDAAQKLALKEQKSLLVCITPGWAESPNSRKLEAAIDGDASAQKYLTDHFVLVRIEDKQNALFSESHGLSQQSYPNVSIWDADGELVARTVGFGGIDGWLPIVKTATDTSARLKAAKVAASRDPAANSELARLLSTIPDRSEDALAALDKVPADKKDDAAKAAEKSLRGKLSWDAFTAKLRTGLGQATRGVDQKDRAAYNAACASFQPTAVSLADAWLAQYAESMPQLVPAAHFIKVQFLALAGKRAEAEAVAKVIEEKFPQSREAKLAPQMINEICGSAGGEKK